MHSSLYPIHTYYYKYSMHHHDNTGVFNIPLFADL